MGVAGNTIGTAATRCSCSSLVAGLPPSCPWSLSRASVTEPEELIPAESPPSCLCRRARRERETGVCTAVRGRARQGRPSPPGSPSPGLLVVASSACSVAGKLVAVGVSLPPSLLWLVSSPRKPPASPLEEGRSAPLLRFMPPELLCRCQNFWSLPFWGCHMLRCRCRRTCGSAFPTAGGGMGVDGNTIGTAATRCSCSSLVAGLESEFTCGVEVVSSIEENKRS
nr:uncharacterized protein LOC112721245 [Arachis hypogaea]